MDLYIKGTGIISAAGDNSNDAFLIEAPNYNTDRLLSNEPDYTAYIAPMQLRRMSKAVRMGIGASKISMQQAGIEKPDAISIGTAMGCLHDTEAFLSKMVEQNEQMLTPTSFIQSTHNTVGGQIALVAGCYGHNLTYVHRGHSFEHTLINAQLYLNEHPEQNMLVGGIDELTPSSIGVLQLTGVYRKDNSSPEDILTGSDKGSIAGEGATFFMVSKDKNGPALCISNISLFTTKNVNTAIEKVQAFLTNNALQPTNIDMVMLGKNGDERSNAFYRNMEHLFADSSLTVFKHISGEYATASAFGLGLIENIIKKQKVPEFTLLNTKQPRELRNILLINNYMHYYSIFHLIID